MAEPWRFTGSPLEAVHLPQSKSRSSPVWPAFPASCGRAGVEGGGIHKDLLGDRAVSGVQRNKSNTPDTLSPPFVGKMGGESCNFLLLL